MCERSRKELVKDSLHCELVAIMETQQDDRVTVESVRSLVERKDELEKTIRELHEELQEQQDVGMTEPLVDAEDYPRSDIDVYRVRKARRDIICLQNDHKIIMGEIEQGLHILHSKDKVEMHQRGPQVDYKPQAMPRPFARVETVTAGSPAHTAGLKPGDGIVGFGSVTSENFQGLQNVSFVVQHSEGKGVNVRVLRDENVLGLTIVPQKWNGRGLLGCNLLPCKT